MKWKVFSRDFKKLRINYVNGSYWNVPTILTLSRYKWTSTPFINFEQLLRRSDSYNQLVWLSLNGDKTFQRFNEIQKTYNDNIRLDYKNKQILKRNHDFELATNVFLRLTPMAIVNIARGDQFIAPSAQLVDFLIKNVGELEENKKYILEYTKFDFDIKVEDITKDENN